MDLQAVISLLIGAIITALCSWFFYRRGERSQALTNQRELEERERREEIERQQREAEAARLRQYQVRLQRYNEFKAASNKNWTVDIEISLHEDYISLQNGIKDNIDRVEVSFVRESADGSDYSNVLRIARWAPGLAITVLQSILEVDYIEISYFSGVSYPIVEKVPVNPQFSMYEYRLTG